MTIVPLSLAPAEAAAAASPARRAEPVTVGLPFPRGLWRDGASAGLRRVDGTYVPLQTRVLDRWSDGSVRWMLLDFQADAPGGSCSCALVVGGPASMPAGPRIDVHERAGTTVIDTGAARFHLRTGASFPFAAVDVAGAPSIDPNRSGLTLIDATGRAHGIRVRRLWVEEAGPLRAAVGITAWLRLSNGRVLDIAGRVEFFAGSAAVRCDVTVRNPRRADHRGGYWELGDGGSVYIRDLAATFTLPESVGVEEARCSSECHAPMTSWAAPVEIYQDSSGGENWRSPNHRDRYGVVPRTIRGYRFRSAAHEHHGLRATPVMSVRRGPHVITVTMRQFWQNFPKTLAIGGDSVVIRLFPSDTGELHELQGGEQKTQQFVVAFAADSITDVPLDWVRRPLVASADPAWYASTGALRHLVADASGIDDGQQELIAAAVDGPDTFARKRELIDEYGWRNFGDLYADHEAVGRASGVPLVSHYNNQYDAIAGFALQFMRTGDRRWHAMMADLAAHVVDIDIYHCTEDKTAYNGGLFWHTAHHVDAGLSTHRTYPRAPGVPGGGPSGEHNYTSGLLLHHFLTGDVRSREVALGLAQWVVNMDDGGRTPFRWVTGGRTGLATQSGSPLYHGPGRGAGNSLNALLDGFRLSRRVEFLEKADEIIRRCIHPDDDIAARNLLDAERRWFYTVFLQALGRYLDEKHERGDLDEMYLYARRSLLQYARWMADHEYPYLEKPELLEYPTETWAAQDIRKSDVFAEAARHASGSERERFLERSAFFFRYSIDTLLTMPTRTLTRPVVILLANGWAYPHLQRHATRPAPDVEDPSVVFPPPPRFVPQKLQAFRRARLAAAAGAVLTAAGAWIVW